MHRDRRRVNVPASSGGLPDLAGGSMLATMDAADLRADTTAVRASIRVAATLGRAPRWLGHWPRRHVG